MPSAKPIRKPAGKKAPAKKTAAKKPAANKAISKKRVAAKAAPKKRPAPANAPARPGPRADFGAPIEGFFERQPEPQKTILETLRGLILEAAPEASSSLKWGMPFFTVGGGMMCAITSHKSHVNLVLTGPEGTYPDPRGLLEGDSKGGRHLKLRAMDDLPREAVRGWLKIAAARARHGSGMR